MARHFCCRHSRSKDKRLGGTGQPHYVQSEPYSLNGPSISAIFEAPAQHSALLSTPSQGKASIQFFCPLRWVGGAAAVRSRRLSRRPYSRVQTFGARGLAGLTVIQPGGAQRLATTHQLIASGANGSPDRCLEHKEKRRCKPTRFHQNIYSNCDVPS